MNSSSLSHTKWKCHLFEFLNKVQFHLVCDMLLLSKLDTSFDLILACETDIIISWEVLLLWAKPLLILFAPSQMGDLYIGSLID
jgi:hypothetical protein